MGLASYKEKGIEAHGYVCDVTDEEQVKAMVAKIKEEVGVIDVDLNAPFIVSKAVIPGMIEKGHGKIINICSEYGEYNIQCNGIGPGYIATPQTAPLRERQADGSRHPFD